MYWQEFTFCDVKPKPWCCDITNAAALSKLTPSGTVIFSLVHVVPL